MNISIWQAQKPTSLIRTIRIGQRWTNAIHQQLHRQTITSRDISVWQTTTIATNIIFLQPSVGDGTSRFLDRWGNFWSVGAAWRISNEAFMEGTGSWLNDLKLRASYGTQGNESILSDYNYAYVYTPYQDQYTVTWNGSELGYSPEFYGNPDLTWEKQKTFDVGVDFRLFDRVYVHSNISIVVRTICSSSVLWLTLQPDVRITGKTWVR